MPGGFRPLCIVIRLIFLEMTREFSKVRQSSESDKNVEMLTGDPLFWVEVWISIKMFFIIYF